VQPLIAPFLWAKLLKRHKKALGQARKSGAEGESLKLLKESALFFRFERDILAVFHKFTFHPRNARLCRFACKELAQHLKVNAVIAEFLFHKYLLFSARLHYANSRRLFSISVI